MVGVFFFSSRRRHTRCGRDWSSDVCSSDLRRWAAPTDVTRTLDPHGIVLKAGKWYLVARSGGQFRCYRVSQILSLTVLDEPFDRDDDFDLPGFWSSFVAEFRDRLYQRNATIRLAPAGRERLRELMSTAVSQAVDETATPPDADGWVTAVVPIESLEHAEAEFLRLGARVEIMSPDDLRKRFAAEAQRLTGLYFPA